MKKLFNLIFILFISSSINAFASLESEIDDNEEDIYINETHNAINYDPYEKFNRAIFKLNKSVDIVILKPVARIYKTVVPEFGRDRIHNFLQNLTELVNFFNGILQLDPKKSTTAISRFMINSFLGIGGINDVADEAGLKYIKTGFSDTLGVYGAKVGPYLVLPIIGSSSVRDAFGIAVDAFSDPFNYVGHSETTYIKTGAVITDKRTYFLDVTDYLERSSMDEYAAYRSLYFQKSKR